jgi:hypothetical protein
MFLFAVFFPARDDAVVAGPAQAASANKTRKVTAAETPNDVADSAKVLTGRKTFFMATNAPLGIEQIEQPIEGTFSLDKLAQDVVRRMAAALRFFAT